MGPCTTTRISLTETQLSACWVTSWLALFNHESDAQLLPMGACSPEVSAKLGLVCMVALTCILMPVSCVATQHGLPMLDAQSVRNIAGAL